MLSETKIKDLEKQGYRMTGNHSCIKVCMWTKKAIRNEDTCYKHKFYDIKSWRCVQMTPSFVCRHRCLFCWRDIDFTPSKWNFSADDPKTMVDESIKEHIKYLQGFAGNPKTDKRRYAEALKPKHFAISLSSEPTEYPKLPELIEEIHSRNMTTFLVTNGTNPEMLKKLLKEKSEPTQLYITLPAPDKETYIKTCNPIIKCGWDKIMQSLKLLKKFKKTVLRLTLVKNVNMIDPEGYGKLIKLAKPNFVEAKAYMNVGYSKERLNLKHMPLHKEIKEFSKELQKHSNYKIKDEKKESRVVLLSSFN